MSRCRVTSQNIFYFIYLQIFWEHLNKFESNLYIHEMTEKIIEDLVTLECIRELKYQHELGILIVKYSLNAF